MSCDCVCAAGELWYCNFERRDGTQTICNLVLDHTASYYWTTLTGDTPSVDTGPSSAYNGDYYIYTDTSGRNQGDTARCVVCNCETGVVYMTSMLTVILVYLVIYWPIATIVQTLASFSITLLVLY